jgi:DNA recombination protein RmuC
MTTVQGGKIDAFAQQLDAVRHSLQAQAQQARDEQGRSLKQFGDTLSLQLGQLTEANDRRFAEVRATIEQRLKDIEANNSGKLEEMRRTVDEKLHATLEQRLGESFKLVSDRLEQVHRGLGEMQTLAAGVGDLKKVLTNVKTRGTWGEVQLEALLEQLLTADQYAKNVATVPKSAERVEFAIRLPGRAEQGAAAAPVWLPIDAKFPREDYERLIEAQERADPIAVEEASRALEARIRAEARTIAEKYVAPPHTTDFALLFLPTEGLYAEVLRRPGLTDLLQRDYRVTIAGPTTLTALLNSLQMGFRTLAIERRSSEVWQVLGAVKTEFGKFGDVLAKTKAQLETVTRSIEAAETRTRVMNRKLRDVEALPGEAASGLLGDALSSVDPDEQ